MLMLNVKSFHSLFGNHVLGVSPLLVVILRGGSKLINGANFELS